MSKRVEKAEKVMNAQRGKLAKAVSRGTKAEVQTETVRYAKTIMDVDDARRAAQREGG